MRYILVCLCALLLNSAFIYAVEDPSNATPSEIIRIGISEAAFDGLNVNDTSAAMKAWIAGLAREQKIDVKMEMMVYPHFKELRHDFYRNELDAVSLDPQEVMDLGVQLEDIFIGAADESIYSRYGVVVRKDSGVNRLDQLVGKNLVTFSGSHLVVVRPWLQTLFARENKGKLSRRLDDLLANTPRVDDPAKAIFQVFFNQAAGAVVKIDSFETACELNPQLQKELHILYESPPLIVNMFLFNPTYQCPMRERLEVVLDNMDTTIRGKQVLTLFRCTRLVRASVDVLDSTKLLLVGYQRLVKQNNIRGE